MFRFVTIRRTLANQRSALLSLRVRCSWHGTVLLPLHRLAFDVLTSALPAPKRPALALDWTGQSHSSVKKAAIIAGMGSNMRYVPTRSHAEGVEEPYAMDPRDLAAAMSADRALGMTPVFVNANVGTTNTCAIDPVRAIGDVCRRG